MHYFIKNIIFFTLLFFFSFSLFAQQGLVNSTTGEGLVVKKNGFLSSLVVDESGMPLIVQIDITDNVTNKIVQQFESSRIGYSRISLASGNYNIVFSKPGFLFHSENFILPDTAGFEKKLKKIILKKVQIGSNTELNNISFEENKSVLKESSFTDLERVILLMNEIISLQIEISGTVDEDLPSKTKSELAEQRAKVLIKYLVSKGIDKERLKYKGTDAEKTLELVQSNGAETNEVKEKTSLTVIRLENKQDIAQTGGGGGAQFGLPENSTKKKTFGKKNKPKTELVQEKTDAVSVNTSTELVKQEAQTEPVSATVVPVKEESAKKEPVAVVKKSVKQEPKPIVDDVVKEEPVKQEVKAPEDEPVEGEGDALKKTVAAPIPQPAEVLEEESKQEENTTVASNDKNTNNVTKSASVNTILSEISFESNKSVLKKSAFSDLDRVIEQMNEIVSLEVDITGIVNEDLPSKTKSELAEQRAQVLINYLVAQGVDRSRLKFKGENVGQPIKLVEANGKKVSADNKKSSDVVAKKNDDTSDNDKFIAETAEKTDVKQEEVLLVKDKQEKRIEEHVKEEKEPVVEEIAKEVPVKQEVKVVEDESVEGTVDALKKTESPSTPEQTEVEEEELKQEEKTTVASNDKNTNNVTKSASVNTILSEISFENKKSVLKKSAFSDLDRVIEQMNEIVSLELEIPEIVNEDLPSKTKSELGEQRAKVLINYLVAQGIDRSRLKYKGENADKSIQLEEAESRKGSDDNKKNVALVEKNENAPENKQAVVESPENGVVKQKAVVAGNNKREEQIEEPIKEEKEPVVEDLAKEESVKQEVKTAEDEPVAESNDAEKKIVATPTSEPIEVVKEEPKSLVEEPDDVAKEVREESIPATMDFAKEETTKEEPLKQTEKAADDELVEESNDSEKKIVATPTSEPIEVEKEEPKSVVEEEPDEVAKEVREESIPAPMDFAKEETAKEEPLKQTEKAADDEAVEKSNEALEKILAAPTPQPAEVLEEAPKSVVEEEPVEVAKEVREESVPKPVDFAKEEIAKEVPVKQEVKVAEDEPIEESNDALKKTVAAPTPQPAEVLEEEPKQEESTTFDNNDKNTNNVTKSASVNTILSEISFENNKSVLKKSAFSDLDRVIEQMNEIVSLELEIPGIVNEDLPSKTKLELADQRATVLINYLVAQGIDRSRLKYKGENADKSIQREETGARKESNDKKQNVSLVEKNENSPDDKQAVVESPENGVVKQEVVVAGNNKREERIEEPVKEEKEPVVEDVAKEEPVKQEVKVVEDEPVEESNDALKKILASPTPQPADVVKEVPKSVVQEEPVEVAKEVREESAPKRVGFAKEETVKEEPVKQEVKVAKNELVEESDDALKKTVAAPTPQPAEVEKEESVESTPVAVEPAKEKLAKEEANTPIDKPVKAPSPSISLPPKFVKYDKDKNGIVSYIEVINGIDDFFDDDSLTNGSEISELIEYFFDN